jgi:hypothetical protein
MSTDAAFWRDLEAQFRELKNPIRLVATVLEGRWSFTSDGPSDPRGRKRLRQLFDSLARRAAIAAGTPNRANALEGWLNRLRDESPYFQPIHGTSQEGGCHYGPSDVPPVPPRFDATQSGAPEAEKHFTGGWIQDLVSASAEYCIVCATRAFELETAAGGDSVAGLRRDRYPFRYWLYDHSHEPIAEPKAELDYWKAHVWRGYHVLIEKYERLSMEWADRHEKLNHATAGLSYDLAVLQANYAIDRGLRGEEAMQAFRDEAALLLEEVTSSWRASCERLAITFEDETEEVKNLAQPFHRVRDDLRRLLHELPATQSLHTVEESVKVRPIGNKRLPATVTSQTAVKRMEAYIKSNGIGQAEFAGRASTTDRTLRTFRRTATVRRDIFDAIAKAMGTTREELLKPE